MKALILLLVAPAAAFAQTANTNCYSWTPNSLQCTTTQQPGIASPAPYTPQIVQPDFVDAYQRGFEFALHAEQTRLQNQLFENQLREQQRRNAAEDQQTILAHQYAVESKRRENAEWLVRIRKAATQSDACIRLNSTGKEVDYVGARACMDRLMVSDPSYALTMAEMNGEPSDESNSIWAEVIAQGIEAQAKTQKAAASQKTQPTEKH